jgi:hypothetical protein
MNQPNLVPLLDGPVRTIIPNLVNLDAIHSL